ncbi:formate C-acetyltransferase [Desulfatibacillum alkenivorans DSM 16219]|jgi:formate C-acetyltransferase|uniref:Formate C-acetyltransferase n=1 Tax=Desulfatibacillum alkenivorans DSM 16219 TaxID=1121393 RepID=A0A1M7B0N6_9BACT|nr:pyruvate formate lyase family protein [Desulfatibacillum alkenivorans]SHL48552.1 formate C-acetyltransferase [Desulfatibacillum alkenivorans DSM 16219]
MAIHPFNQWYKDHILTAPYEICIERARYYTQSYRETEGMHPSLRAAKALHLTLSSMSLSILQGEQIIGNRSSKTLGVVIPVERGDVNAILEMELDFLLKRRRQPFSIDPDDRRELEEDILPYWRGRTVRDRKKVLWKENGLNFKPAVDPLSLYKRHKSLDLSKIKKAAKVPGGDAAYALKGMKEILHNNPALVMNIFDVQGHLILGIKNVLSQGFLGIREQAEKGLAEAKEAGKADDAAFYESVIISCEAAKILAERLARKAEETASEEDDPDRQRELLAAAKRCRHSPWNPPRTFHEAVQAMWLILLGGLVSHGMVGILAVGRLDQYLYPYYAKDVENGLIDQPQAVRLMEELLIKLGANLMILPYVGKNTGNELGSDSCVPTIGGVDDQGRDAVNPLTYAVLEAFANVKSLGNSFTVRLSQESPPEFWQKALETYRETSGAALFNDEIVVSALQNCGMTVEDARDYGVIGCVEPTGDGDAFGCTSGNDVSLSAALEMALGDGHLRVMGKAIGPRTGNPKKFKTFDQVLDAFKKQVEFMVDTVARAVNLKDRIYMEEYHNPYISCTLKGCLDNARDMTQGGAKYNFGSISGRGMGTAADSLAAIKFFVFDQKTFSMAKILKMLDCNFKGYDKERAMLAHRAPAFGSDDPYADEIAREVCAFFCNTVASKQTLRGGPFRPSFFSYGVHVLEGLYIGATPNGRLAGTPVSNSLSPTNGSEKQGPTGVLGSVAKLDHSLISNGSSVNIKLMPSMFQGEERLQKMIGLVKGFFASGGMEVQPNVVSNQTLLDAQKHPENYRDLVVRVSGYSAFFTDLGKPIQDEIIQRTEFERL